MQTKTLSALLCALVMATTAFAQQQAPKVWTDADLLKPLPVLEQRPAVDPAILAAFKARAERVPFMGNGFSGGYSERGGWSQPARSLGPVEAFYRRQALAPPLPEFYAAQPLYPFVSVVYSRQRPHQAPARQSQGGRRW